MYQIKRAREIPNPWWLARLSQLSTKSFRSATERDLTASGTFRISLSQGKEIPVGFRHVERLEIPPASE